MKFVKILFTPLVFVIALIVNTTGYIYYRVLVRIYEYTWEDF
jgi:hypothetical protein